MAGQVLICGRTSAEELAELLLSNGAQVSYTAELPSSGELIQACDAVILSLEEHELEGAASIIEAVARVHGRSGVLVAALVPRGHSRIAISLLAAGADEAASDPEEIAGRVSARLQNSITSRGALAMLVRLAQVTGGSLELPTCARAVLEGLRRALPGCNPSLAIASRVGENDPEPLFLLLNGHLEQLTWRGRDEIEAALAARQELIFGEGGAAPSAPLQARMDQAGATSALVMPLFANGKSVGALSLTLPDAPTEADLSLARAAAGLAGNALANALAHTRVEKRRSALESAYIDRYRELLEANRRLRELNHMKDEFLAICAHDLRSPLNVVLGHSRLLLDARRGPLSAEAKKSSEAISRQATRMLELIEDLLDLRALETGRLELRRRETDLCELVSETCETMQLMARERGVILGETLPEQVLLAEVDPSKLREVLMNLVSNALKFTPAGGRVDVELERGGEGTIRMRVRDTGPGIPSDELPRLFERYRRGREGRANGRGNGLGLAISREIVELHGGAISAESELGQGSLFTVNLPGTSKHTAPVEPVRHRPAVLVVEDDADSRAIIVDLLAASHEVLEAADGEEGVRIARERSPDLILMDLFMPRLDGFAAMEDLRRDPRTSDVPVIILSAQGDELTKVRGLNLGASDYLAKPFSGRELLARVEKTLKGVQQREALRTLAQTDALTGLANFRAFRSRLDEEFKRARRYRTPLACVMIDLDNLKQINDRQGHATGNKAIAAISTLLKAELRETDFAARYGGDEFVVLLPHSGAEEAAVFAERVRERLGRTVLDGHGGLVLRASFGVAAVEGLEKETSDQLWKRADSALYAAKEGGRNRVVQATAGQQESAPTLTPATA